jgi:lipopolysaccharide export system protein LptA
MSFAKTFLAATLVGLLGLPLLKLAAHAAGNVDVEADSMEIIDADHRTIFRGNVVAKRPTDTIRAEEMIVSSSEQKQSDGSTKTITDFVDAKGDVTINTRDAVITGEWCKFDVPHDQLVVGGNVKIVQGQSVVRGQKLDVDLKTFHLQMSGGRVTGSFTPK